MRSVLLLTMVAAIYAAWADVPLPEHPRPDWERAEWVNLNGEWDFGFAAGRFDRKIRVPFGWGTPASGVPDDGDRGYYRRKVTVPTDWKGKRVFVIVGASDHDTTCRFDGETLGSYSGGYVPFEFELTDSVRWGEEQTLEFDVWDPSAREARNGHYLYGKQGYGNARGIWQTVYLEARGDVFLDSVRFRPNLEKGTVAVAVAFGSPAKDDGIVELAVAGKTEKLFVSSGDIGAHREIELDAPHLWSLEDPYLYEVTLVYGADRVKTYFGFREIGVGCNPQGDAYVTLNGKPVYLQMCLDQSYHPEGGYTFPSDAVMKNEILISKQLALTGNRIHVKVEVPRKLYWADKLGVLIQADVPCAWGDVSEKMFEEHWKCFEAMVRRDYNHPSIYQWTLFNETWGLFSNRSLAMGLASGAGGKKRAYRADTQRRVVEVYRKATNLDVSRIIEDNSPCSRDHVVTDVNTWHSYFPGYEWERRVAEFCAQTFPGSTHNYIGGHVQTDAPMMNSECGNVWGYHGSTGDCDFTWDYHLMMNAFRRHLKCGGWLYTEHHDVCNEWNGYVRFDRTWKETGFEDLAGMTLADLHRPAFIYFAGREGHEIGEVVPAGGTLRLPVGVSFTTDAYAGKRLELLVAGEKVGAAVEGKSWQCETLWEVDLEFPAEPACGVKTFVLMADGREIARNFWCYSTVAEDAAMVRPVTAVWSEGTAEVLDGLKLNGFGRGYFEYSFTLPQGGESAKTLLFRAELSSKRKNGKDRPNVEKNGDLDYMLGGGSYDRSRNPNSYPQTSAEKFPANLKVYVNGACVKEEVLPDDPADHRGILSWLAQPFDGRLREAGSYGYQVEVPIPAEAVKDGQVTIRLESDGGLAVYGPRFGRYPFGPEVK
ncbi:MAG: sugar-binding domain-containing protein [Kiritimatiellia bacterium]